MGTYVYALNTKTINIGNIAVGAAEFRYKPSWGWDGEKYNRKMEFAKVAPRERSWKDRNLPEYFVYMPANGEGLREGQEVFRTESVSWYDDKVFEIVGRLLMVDGELTISFLPNFRVERCVIGSDEWVEIPAEQAFAHLSSYGNINTAKHQLMIGVEKVTPFYIYRRKGV